MPKTPNKKIDSPDFSAIEFPSDRITFAQIRKEQPGLFTYDALGDIHAMNLNAVCTVMTELCLAEKAWASALGQPDPHPDDDRREEIVMLNDDYVRYGLSTGIAKTRQMVRAFETAVAEQARLTVGQGL